MVIPRSSRRLAVPWGDFCFRLKMAVQGSGMRVIGRREDLVPCRRHTRFRKPLSARGAGAISGASAREGGGGSGSPEVRCVGGRAGAVEVVLGAALSPCPGPGRSRPCGTLLCSLGGKQLIVLIGKRHKTWVFFRRPRTLQRISGHVWLWWLHTSKCTGLTCASEQRAFSGLRRLVTRFRGAAGSRGLSSDVLCVSPGVANAHVLRFSSGAKPTLCL